MDFVLSMLQEYYKGEKSQNALCKERGIDITTFLRWRRRYEGKGIPLPCGISALESQVYKMAQKRHEEDIPSPKTEEDRLREENERLRKAMSYSELRNEALSELIKIGKERYGLDLLKKAGAKR